MKLADSLNPATQAENIKKLNAGLEAVDAKTLPGTSTATTGQILKLTGENKTPAWADEYSYTPPAYSETEVNTGQKWIDGKDVYCKVFSGTTPESGYSSLSVTYDTLLCFTGYILNNSNNRYDINKQMTIYGYDTNKEELRMTASSQTQFQGTNYSLIVYYTKPDPAPETRDDDTPEEVKETKTRKKTQNKKED